MESFLLSASESSITHPLPHAVSTASGTGVVKIPLTHLGLSRTRTSPAPPSSAPRTHRACSRRSRLPRRLVRPLAVLPRQPSAAPARQAGWRTPLPVRRNAGTDRPGPGAHRPGARLPACNDLAVPAQAYKQTRTGSLAPFRRPDTSTMRRAAETRPWPRARRSARAADVSGHGGHVACGGDDEGATGRELIQAAGAARPLCIRAIPSKCGGFLLCRPAALRAHLGTVQPNSARATQPGH